MAWWGPWRPLDRAERPPLIGTRRQGPDLLQVGNRRSEVWQEIHLKDPRRLNPGTRMPSYAHLFAGDGRRGQDLVAYLASLGKGTSVERWAMTKAETPPPPPAAPSLARGARLFATYCAACHGANGAGRRPSGREAERPLRQPAQTRRLSAPASPSPASIRHGLPPTSMPGHEWLTDQQVADLVAYVSVPVRPSPSVLVPT